jgi:hypothetical protein
MIDFYRKASIDIEELLKDDCVIAVDNDYQFINTFLDEILHVSLKKNFRTKK